MNEYLTYVYIIYTSHQWSKLLGSKEVFMSDCYRKCLPVSRSGLLKDETNFKFQPWLKVSLSFSLAWKYFFSFSLGWKYLLVSAMAESSLFSSLFLLVRTWIVVGDWSMDRQTDRLSDARMRSERYFQPRLKLSADTIGWHYRLKLSAETIF